MFQQLINGMFGVTDEQTDRQSTLDIYYTLYYIPYIYYKLNKPHVVFL